jgi:glycosyltransferase involved in cell wall biosynthesis
MRVGVIHNLRRGGAHRRLAEQVAHLRAEVVEVCPSTATPIRSDATVIDLHQLAPRVVRGLRVPLRYLDLLLLLAAWRAIARRVRGLDVDVVFANPCQLLQAPAALLSELPASLYFCDEPRRFDSEQDARDSQNPATRHVYAPMYAAARQADRRAVARAGRVVTNSTFSASEIRRAYGRPADVLPMGVPDICRTVRSQSPAHILSVGALIPSKGHEIAIAAASRRQRAWPVVIVAPRPEAGEAERLRAVARSVGVSLEIRVGISDPELADAYASAQATVYMARREPYGLASLEAQAAGSPVIVSAEGGLPETIDPGRSGWAVARTAAAVAAKLDQLEEPGVREAASAAARAHAASATWARSARSLEMIFEQLSAGPR